MAFQCNCIGLHFHVSFSLGEWPDFLDLPVEKGAKPAPFLTISGFEYHRSGTKLFRHS